MTYRMNDPDLDARIAQLVADATPDGTAPDDDLVAEIVVTALKLLRDEPDRGELKMMNTALKELRYSSLVFDAHRGTRKVAAYGSARTDPDASNS